MSLLKIIKKGSSYRFFVAENELLSGNKFEIKLLISRNL